MTQPPEEPPSFVDAIAEAVATALLGLFVMKMLSPLLVLLALTGLASCILR